MNINVAIQRILSAATFFLYRFGEKMRVDKYLKNSRLIKRRTVAKEACDQGRILINDLPAKPGSTVSINDIISMDFSSRIIKVKVLDLREHVNKDDAKDMYEVVEG
jgi:ribosomal 50S subunit-recycling heat shock protein